MGDIDAVKKFIENGFDLRKNHQILTGVLRYSDIIELIMNNGADFLIHSNCALVYACLNGYLSTVKVLINHGADFRFDNDNALRQAATYGKFDVVKFLVDTGCDIRADNDYVLTQAVKYGNLEIVKIFVNLGVDITAIKSVLESACESGKLDLVEYVVHQVTDTSYNYHDAIQIADRRNYFSIFTYLLAKVSDSETVTNIIIYLSDLGNFDMVKYVFDNKQQIGNIDEALTNVIKNGHTHIINYLIEKGANIKINFDNVFDIFSELKVLRCISFLIDTGIDIPINTAHVTETGFNIPINTAYIIDGAACYGYLDIIKYFINKGYDIQSQLDNLIKNAIRYDNLNIVKFFFDEFEIINIDTYFKYACVIFCNMDSIKFFSVNYIKKETINEAAELAFESNNFDILIYLVEHGASIVYLKKIKQELESDTYTDVDLMM